MKRVHAYRSALLSKKAEVLSTLGFKFDTLAMLGRIAEDDQAQVSHDEFISLHLNGLEYHMLREVNEALLRMEHGEYGICARCEEPIPEKRLRALPWAKHCVACQEEVSHLEETEYAPRHHLDPVSP
jgi:DnaK suppressor protein